MLPPPSSLPEELLEEVFLRLPPDEPVCLVRASLASKLWLGILTDPSFHGRYGDFHGAPPMLGFLLSYLAKLDQEKHPIPHFVSTMKFGWRQREYDLGQMGYDSLNCRHGRVLLEERYIAPRKLTVWDPMTGCRRELGTPLKSVGLGAAVLCAVAGCDHHVCHDGPFWVLLFGLSLNDGADSVHVWVFSSEAEEWSEPCSGGLHLGSGNALVNTRRPVLFQNALYDMILYPDHIEILKYDMGSNCMSLLGGPRLARVATAGSAILMTMEDASLGFAYLDRLTLYLWSRQTSSDGVAAWTQRRAVDLKELLPIQNPKKRLRLIGFKESSGIIFVTTDLGIYEINLKSLEWKKLWKREKFRALIPYLSFYNPPSISKERPPYKAAH